ncbi:hypothetical protein J6590_050811 [Homalodisca vitripennis]|nr:hypothetical protein J6590_050811 [Homalodisca vitripennis]
MAGNRLCDSEIDRFMNDYNNCSEEFSTGSDQSDVEWDRVTREQFENSDIFDSEEELPTPDIGPATDDVGLVNADQFLKDVDPENQGL